MTDAHRQPDELASSSGPADQVIQRWHDLRGMLIRQLDMFEDGGLTLRSNNSDASSSAVADLKSRILEFNTLISGQALRSHR